MVPNVSYLQPRRFKRTLERVQSEGNEYYEVGGARLIGVDIYFSCFHTIN